MKKFEKQKEKEYKPEGPRPSLILSFRVPRMKVQRLLLFSLETILWRLEACESYNINQLSITLTQHIQLALYNALR